MVKKRETIPKFCRTIQVSELLYFAHIYNVNIYILYIYYIYIYYIYTYIPKPTELRKEAEPCCGTGIPVLSGLEVERIKSMFFPGVETMPRPQG